MSSLDMFGDGFISNLIATERKKRREPKGVFGSFHTGGVVHTPSTGLRSGEMMIVASSVGTGKTTLFSEEKTDPETTSTPFEDDET